ncbi:hypothetical protein Poli38472_011922 [Pythium oligandrum]|uniref:Conserved oligomeric Golgi complex subunit 7 n=1 Tax=Pythium oligandrum TaxID=41045 RepID=A0A8K1FEV1_PYTOL|nr:hypothetical protein Poli38472_011922 [Pythium oligandrum]|eukprot:TMW58334.1 hypothetical protein Poli38472_011922 [Pythium oligandrum]
MELADDVFGDDAFDCYAWLEEAVIDRHGEVGELVNLVPQLTLLSQSLTKSIHGTLHQLTVTGPQLQAQLDAMQRVTTPLAQQLDSVASSVSSSTASPSSKEHDRDLQQLLTLHEAKERLQACSTALVEAARWEKNVRACAVAIEEILTTKEARLEQMLTTQRTLADRVGEMQTSLEILKDMPGADDRQRTMERMCVQIETALKPRVDAYLQEIHLQVAHLQSCIAVFSSIQRRDHIVQAYCKGRPAHIHRYWYAFNTSEGGTFSTWLEGFYNEVLRMLQREAEHAHDLFPSDADAVLTSLLVNTLVVLKDSFIDRLKKGFTMDEMLQAHQRSCVFTSQATKILRSTSMSQDDETVSKDVAKSVIGAVFAPYEPFFMHYSQWATQSLTTKLFKLLPSLEKAPSPTTSESKDEVDDLLSNMTVDNDNALDSYAHRLEDTAKEICAAVDESLRQSYEFSAGATFPEAVSAVSASFQELTMSLISTIPQIRSRIGLEDKASESKSPGFHSGSVMLDWGRFHAALALLRSCGAIESELRSAEFRLGVRVQQQLQSYLGDGSASPGSSSPRGRRKELKRRLSDSTGVSLAMLSEPTRVAAMVASVWLQEDTDRSKALVEFADSLVANSTSVLMEPRTALTSYTQAVQRLTYDAVFTPIAKVLESVPALESWNKVADASLGDLPSFSTLPQEYITMVADLLLSLLPQLEPFAESNSLPKAALASQNVVAHVSAPEWARLGSMLRLSKEDITVCQGSFHVEDTTSESGDTSSAATTFVDLWTNAVASGTVAMLLTAICAIPALSPLAVKQLEADVAYFQNVLTALGGGYGEEDETNFLIKALHRTLGLSDAEYAEQVENLTATMSAGTSQDKLTAEERKQRVLLALHQSLLRKRSSVYDATSATAQGQYF